MSQELDRRITVNSFCHRTTSVQISSNEQDTIVTQTYFLHFVLKKMTMHNVSMIAANV